MPRSNLLALIFIGVLLVSVVAAFFSSSQGSVDYEALATGIAASATIKAGGVVVLETPAPTAPDLTEPIPVSSPLPTVTPLATVTMLEAPDSVTVNGISAESFVVMSDEVKANVLEIFRQGQIQGRNPRAFSKLGDSTIENPHFLARFDGGAYNLGNYAYLQSVIEYFSGSFGRQGKAIQRGLHTWSVLDPMWVSDCLPNEHMLACEFRQHNPGILIIRLGSNDKGVPESSNRSLRRIVEYTISQGVIPILGTKADRYEGAGNIINGYIRQIATEYVLPLWDYDLLAGTIAGRGLEADGVHMSFFFAHDWTQTRAFQTGHGVHNLSALIALDQVWRVISGE